MQLVSNLKKGTFSVWYLFSVFFRRLTCKWVVTAKKLFESFVWIPMVGVFRGPSPTGAKLGGNTIS